MVVRLRAPGTMPAKAFKISTVAMDGERLSADLDSMYIDRDFPEKVRKYQDDQIRSA